MPLVIEYREGAVSNVRVIGKLKVIVVDWDMNDEDDDTDATWGELLALLRATKRKDDVAYLERVLAEWKANVAGEGNEY